MRKRIQCNFRSGVPALVCPRSVFNQNPSKHKKAWKQLRACHGILVPGGFGSRGLEGKIQAIKYARFGS